MDIRALGNTGINVPIIGMGTWKTFDVSGQAAESVRQQIVETAIAEGANFFDSSPMYGQAERVLGQAVENLGARQKVMIATKVWTNSDEQSEQQFATAFGYFGGYLDLYQVHNLVSWQKRLQQLEAFKAQGKVKSIGITHYSHRAFDEMAQIMRSGRVETIQVPYNAVDRKVEEMILPLAASLNIGVLIMRPFDEGDLLRRIPGPNELAPFAEYGVTTWPQVLLKWIASDPRISVIIPATSRPERMVENASAGNPPWFDAPTRERVSRMAQQYA